MSDSLEDTIDLEGEETLNDHVVNSEDYPNIIIKIDKESFSIFELKRRFEEKKSIKLELEFQRKPGVWDAQQNSELVESILMGIPIPIMYFFENSDGTKEVVDGRQRLTCLFNYMNNKFKLSDLSILPKQNGKYFKDLDPKLQSKLEDYQLNVYTMQHPTPEKVKFNIFDRVNRGGTRLNNQEMRNALYSGKSTRLLKNLSESEPFLTATGKGVSSKRMKDRYIILRYLGFYLLRTKKLLVLNKETNSLEVAEYRSDRDEFLASVMIYINEYCEEDELNDLEKTFSLAMSNCYKFLGEDGFRFNKDGKKLPINMGLFESLSFLFSIDLPKNTNKEFIKNRIEKMKQEMDESGNFGGTIDSNKGVAYRFEKVEEVRNELTNA